MKKALFARLATITASVVAATAPVLSHAAADAAFTSAVTETTTNIALYGAALVGVSAVGVGFMIAMKYVKKIRGAA